MRKTLILGTMLALAISAQTALPSDRLTQQELDRLIDVEITRCQFDVGLAIKLGTDISDSKWPEFCHQFVMTKVGILLTQTVD